MFVKYWRKTGLIFKIRYSIRYGDIYIYYNVYAKSANLHMVKKKKKYIISFHNFNIVVQKYQT